MTEVAGDENGMVYERGGGDAQVGIGEPATGALELVADAAVALGGEAIEGEHKGAREQADGALVELGALGVLGAVGELADGDGGGGLLGGVDPPKPLHQLGGGPGAHEIAENVGVENDHTRVRSESRRGPRALGAAAAKHFGERVGVLGSVLEGSDEREKTGALIRGGGLG